MRARLWLSLSSALALAACSDNTGSNTGLSDSGVSDSGPGGDGGDPRDTGAGDVGELAPNQCDPNIRPITGGGAGGGRVRGSLTVFVNAGDTGDPIEGATVIAQFEGYQLEAMTDANGCVAFRDQRLGGAGRIHVFARDRIYLSLVGFSAAVTGVNLAPLAPLPARQPATVAGLVTGFDVLSSSTATIARLGYVEPIPTDVFVDQPDQTLRMENMNVGSNVVVVGRNGALEFRDYLLHVAPFATVGVAIRAGTIQFPRAGPPFVQLTHDGFLLDIDAEPGAAITGKDIEITHPLTETFTLSYGMSPDLPQFVALAYVVLPGRTGWFFHGQALERSPTSTDVFTELPALTGVLSGGSYGAAVQASSETAYSTVVHPGTSSSNLDVGDLPAVPTDIVANGRSVSATVRAPAGDLVLFGLRRESGGRWTIAFVNTTGEPAITLPAPPAGYEDPLSGELELSVLRATYEGVHFNEFSFDDLNDTRIRALAGDTVNVNF